MIPVKNMVLAKINKKYVTKNIFLDKKIQIFFFSLITMLDFFFLEIYIFLMFKKS
jgi:hypothetical protein